MKRRLASVAYPRETARAIQRGRTNLEVLPTVRAQNEEARPYGDQMMFGRQSPNFFGTERVALARGREGKNVRPCFYGDHRPGPAASVSRRPASVTGPPE